MAKTKNEYKKGCLIISVIILVIVGLIIGIKKCSQSSEKQIFKQDNIDYQRGQEKLDSIIKQKYGITDNQTISKTEEKTAYISPVIRDKDNCVVMAERFVKTRLKSPSSADFETRFVHEILPNGNARVTGKFYATNSFGAKILNTYQIVLSYHGSDYADDWANQNNWKVESLIIQ